MKPTIPEPLKKEHEELHIQLSKAIESSGKTGQAAKKVAGKLNSHFIAEEEFAIPPLGILPQLAEGNVTKDMKEVLNMTEKLKAELPQMLDEHKEISSTLDELIQTANEEDKPEVVEFAKKLKLHAQTEEEVSYPTALLIGEYLKLKFN